MSAAGLCERCEAHGALWSAELGVGLCGDCFAKHADATVTASLLAAIERFAGRYLVLPGDHEWTALVLWIAHTHAIDGAHATPYLLLLSPEKRSGKTRTQEVLELLVARPWRVTGASEAAIFRRIAADRPTLLLDEIDAVFASFAERTEPLRAILNAGSRPGASVARCVGEKGAQVHDFSVYCAKCLAGIDTGRLPDTIRDRSIALAMRRRTPAEPVERLRWRDAERDAEPLRDRLAEWGEAAAEGLLDADPEVPVELDDRAAEAWEPLLAIADLAGDEWPRRARKAAVTLSVSDKPELSLGSLLLAAIRTAFGDRDRMTTAELLERINADEELPFGGWRDGAGLNSRGLARMLRPYDIRPRTIRIGDDPNKRGYPREQFTDAWERWVPPPDGDGDDAERSAPPPPTEVPHPPHATAAPTDEPLDQANVVDVAFVAHQSGRVAENGSRGSVPLATPEEEAKARRLGSESRRLDSERRLGHAPAADLISAAQQADHEARELGLTAFDDDDRGSLS